MRTIIAFSLLISASASAHGQDRALQATGPDVAAPTLEARSDDLGTPWWAFGVDVDVVAVAFGDYQIGLELGVHRFFGVTLRPGWRRENGHGPMLGLQAELWPLGRGLDGLAIIASSEVAWVRSDDRVEVLVGAEAAYRYVWKGLLLGVSAGVGQQWVFGAQRTREIVPLVRVQLGWAWS